MTNSDTAKVILVAIITVVASVACTSSGGQRDGSTLPQADLNALLSHTSGSQRDALADGVVTPDEYETAMLATVECMAEAGFEMTVEREDWRLLLKGAPVSSLDDVKRWGQTYNDCAVEFSQDIEAVYSFQHRPSEQEVLQRKDDAVKCVQAQGLDIPSYEILWELRLRGEFSAAEQQIVLGCMREAFPADIVVVE